MAKFVSYKEMGKKIAEEALDGYIYKGKTLREWVEIVAKQKTGHWIDRFPAKECKCSVCEFLICISNGSYIDMVGQMKYCPNCGAKMEESEDIKNA